MQAITYLKNDSTAMSKSAETQNDEVLRHWRESAFYWQKHFATIQTMFQPVTQALIDDARIIEGQSVLDVAGGSGEPSVTIADKVGPTGLVTCTDAVAEMVEAAKTQALLRGLKNVQFRQCSADSLPFPDDSFDTVVSRLGVMFFPNPLAALREMLRVTKPGGIVAVAVWHFIELNPYAHVVTKVVSRYLETPPIDNDAPDAFRFARLGKLIDILKDAGAVKVEERVIKFAIAAPISPEEFWAMRTEISDVLRDKLITLSEEDRKKMGMEVQQAVRPFFRSNQMRFPAQMIIVRGSKPQSADCTF
jgi:ubiquinone/menaquinone biosynthesis C-methylase UbiE